MEAVLKKAHPEAIKRAIVHARKGIQLGPYLQVLGKSAKVVAAVVELVDSQCPTSF